MAKKLTRDVPLPSSNSLFGEPSNPKKTFSKTRASVLRAKNKNPNIDETGYKGQSLNAVTSGAYKTIGKQVHKKWVASNKKVKQLEAQGVGGGVLKSAKADQKKYRNMMMSVYKAGKRSK